MEAMESAGASQTRAAGEAQASGAFALREVAGRSCTVIEGAPGCDVTSELARRVGELVRSGADPAEVLLAVASASQKAPARRALACELGTREAKKVRVARAAELATEILDAPKARTATGRVPRVLAPFERNAISEDLKTLGMQTKRLREMLKFLHKGLATLQDRDEGWLVISEEVRVLETERALLRECGGVLDCELANLAVGYLEGVDGDAAGSATDRPGFAHVLVDGWTALSPASQALLDLLATRTLVVAGHPDDPGVAGEPYHNAHGLDDVYATCPQALHITLARRGAPRIERPVWQFPADEFAGVAQLVQTRLAEGAAPRDVVVVAPNRPWVRRVERALREAGVPVLAGEERPLRGDPRTLERCGAQRAFVLLELAADPHDPLAWRLWTGFGDWLLDSVAWKELRPWCAQQGIAPVEGLARLAGLPAGASEPFLGAHRLAEAARAARAALAQLDGLAGEELARAACAACGCAFEELPVWPGEELPTDPMALVALLRARVVAPAFPADADAVRVGTPGFFVGERVPHVVICGLVDGFMPGPQCFDASVPPDIQQRNLAEERARFDRAAGIATETLALSRFDREWLFDAEPARMEIARIRAEEQGRLALIRPSAFVEPSEP